MSKILTILANAAFCVLALFLIVSNAWAACDLTTSITHDLSASYGELCGVGEVTIRISHPSDETDLTDLVITEDLGSSGLTYVPGTTTFSVRYGSVPIPIEPSVTGSNGSVLTWDLGSYVLQAALNNLPWFAQYLEINFQVIREASLGEEGLISSDRTVNAGVSFSSINESIFFTPCSDTQTSGPQLLPLREPIPSITKLGRNVDANQGTGNYSNPVYGNINDDVIWRIGITNTGLADMQDVRFDDLMQPGNFQINYACPTEAEAQALAAGDGVGPIGNCTPASNTISNFVVIDPYGNTGTTPDGYEIDVTAGGTASIYLVGKIISSCVGPRTNTAQDLAWGCEADGNGAGPLTVTSTGATPGVDSADLSSLVNNAGLNITTRIRGLNGSQPVGSRGLVTITITNNTGGSIRDIHLRDVLPPQYVVDPTFRPAVSVTPAYGAYPGMIDTVVWTNPQPNTFPLTSIDPADPLANIAPEFDLTSSGISHPLYPDQINMLRHDDVAVLRFHVVMIEPGYFDKVADLDVRTENTGDNTDPDNSTTLTNELYVDFVEYCNPAITQSLPVQTTQHQANPEDLDVDFVGNELIFILTGDPAQRLPLTVNLTNNGGHDADNYFAYVTFGITMDVVSVPAGCSVTSNPPPLPEWQLPAPIPADATVYQCTGAPIPPGQTVALNFEVVKSTDPAAIAADDLTFRTDVTGQITLNDGTLLWFPVPTARSDGIIDSANNHTIDGLRARVIGFDLRKSQVGICTENNPPPALPDLQVQIGEECTYHVETGGWFGFQTPGFTYIAVQDIQVVDESPNGQGYLSSTDPYATSTAAVQSISLNPATLGPLDEGWFDWTFNTVVPAERITDKDHWFRVDFTTRLLNDPVDSSAPPNQHAALSRNVLNSYFQAVFDNSGVEEIYDLGPNTVGYPREAVRRVDLTVTEPNIIVVKEVCNETLYGAGPACSNFVPLANDGDAYNFYIYRITLTNEASSSGVQRAPAYEVTVTDRLDVSDLAYVLPFASDGLDNDGDGSTGGADTNGEGVISDNIVKNGVPAEITFSHTHSNVLQRIDPGQSVTLHYRVDYDDDAAPLQAFTNTAEATYDSLEGDSGNQSVPQRPNSDIGGARVYTSQPESAAVQIIPVLTQPKRIGALSNTPPVVGPTAQGVSIGEEIGYRLNTLLPVALLRNFVIRDELPAGLRCIEAPVINLNAPPYSAAGFVPGGIFTPTCTDTFVEWNFGDQRVTNGTVGNRYDFEIGFIGRVENTAGTNDGNVISNGDPATNATVSYINETGGSVNIDFNQVDVLVREPLIALTKAFAVANGDAGDILTVTVTATNTGTATAYNLRMLDDLVGLNLTFIGNVGGADPPDNIDTTTLGANRPIFSWNMPNGIAPSDAISFTFEVRVDTIVQPHEVLDNTIQARWASLPGQNTALNSTGMIGADGSNTGMRIGTLPNGGDAINDYETNAAHQVTVPAAIMAKTDLTPALIPAIGAHKNFQIEISLPEGISNGVLVTDSLDAAGLSYILANNAAFDITYTFEGIAAINGQPPDEAAFNAFPADGAGGSAVWNIGTVVTQTENDSVSNTINPVIRINYYARVNNDLVTDSGDSLQNSVVVNYTNGGTGAQETLTAATAAVTVLEPVLTVTKTVSNATPGKQPADPPSGGDLLEYVITIPNSGTATAYDVNVVDTVPAGLAYYTGFTPTAMISGVAVAGFVADPANAPAGPFIWGRGNSDSSLDIPVGQSLVLTYQVVVQEASGVLSNSVSIDWTALDGTNSYERTGDGCPSWTPPNDYCTGPAIATTTTVDDNNILKTITADTYDVPLLSTASDSIARVGDTITYRLALNLRGGLTRTVQVQDVLPDGMALVNIVSINGDNTLDYIPPFSGTGSNFSYAPITAVNVPTAGQTGTLTWTIGDIVNDPFGDPTTDTFEIIYRARIMPDAGIPHVDTSTLTNTAILNYVDAPSLTNTDTVTLRQPIINQVTKIDRSGRTSPAAVNVATDIMQFRLEACNTSGLAPAYSVELTDQLASQLDEGSIANLVVSVGGSVLSSGTDYIYTPPAVRGGTMEFLLNSPVNAGQCLIIDYDIGFYTDFGPNQVWNNSATLDAYWSLPAQSGQLYGPLGPAIFSMNNVANIEPPAKTIFSPVTGEATIGEEIVYQITVPGTVVNAAMYDIVITDTLDSNLEYLVSSEISANSFTLTDNSVPPGQVSLSIDQIPAGQQAVIELHVRLRNIVSANAGVSFTNTAIYTYADSPGGATLGGGSDTSPPILIIEPSLTLAKSVVNFSNPGNPPQSGDILRYTLDFTAAGGAVGDNFSDAFDLSINDTMSLGLAYNGNPIVNGAGNTINAPVIVGDGTTTPQTMVWSPGTGNADIDLNEGAVVNVSYDVLVLDNVLIDQTLSNSATARWTGLDGTSIYERTGTGVPALNDYFTGPATTTLTVPDNTTITKTRLQDTFGAADANVRIGDIVDYELRLGLQEGTHPNVVLTDNLPQGLVFEGIVDINGDTGTPFVAAAPFVHGNIDNTNIFVADDPGTGPTTVTWSLGDIVNTADSNSANDEFIITYRARVLNDAQPQVNPIPLTNTVDMDYDTAAGPATPLTDNETINLLQPDLTVTKSAVAAGGDTLLAANEIVTYTVDIINTGSAPAYDTVLEDIIPLGIRNGSTTITMFEMRLLPGGMLPGSILPNLAPVYDANTGIANWNFDTGIADQYTIPAGDTLRIVYQVQADSAIGAGMTLTNQAQVILYYSLDDEAVPTLGGVTGVRQIYGPSNIATTTLTTATPDALTKQKLGLQTAAIGEPFSYTITVPTTPQAINLYDVRILDDLSASAASLSFIGVSKPPGPEPWTPVNTGNPPQLVIEDPTIGIDIPAGEQITINITVVLNDAPLINVSGLPFTNTATYTYNQFNDDPTTQNSGGSDFANMTIVGPDLLTMLKSGPATMQLGTPGTFTLDLHNPGVGTAWNPTITDLLPLVPQGGMCSTAPVNVTAQIFDGGMTLLSTLTEGSDFTITFLGNPTCEWTLTLLSSAGGVGPDQHLIITYDASLDPGTVNAISLTNIAGVTNWFGADPATAVTPHNYTETLTDGSPTPPDDFQDDHTVDTEAPILVFQKTVQNVTTGLPGSNASPRDILHYTLQVTNIGPVELSSFAIEDEVDRLNTPAVFAPGTLTNLTTVPAGVDTSSAFGGINGTGLVRVDSLSIAPSGTVTVDFDITLAPVIASNTVVLNQAQLDTGSPVLINSDDPNIAPGSEDPTETLITSAPAFEVWKTAQDLTGDPAIHIAGDTLRYTIIVKNIGSENATNMSLRDQIPANTTYIANSTTLNGTTIADPGAGVSPLQNGLPINAPEDLTQGAMRADATPTPVNEATITFDVSINTEVLDGTIIANQAFLNGDGAGSGPVPEEPSDDPGTVTLDDPTRVVVGNLPLVDVQKTVEIVVDNGSPNILDPVVDLIRYTITITNSGAIPATGVEFTDAVPANTTYEANSVTLNTLAVGLTDDLGVSPLINGIPVSSSDLTPTPPLPTAGNGILSPGSSAIITFDVRVNLGVPAGTIISNQGTLSTNELPDEPTDADGIDSNGDQPTQIVVGNAQLLGITKNVFVVGGGTADPGSMLEYEIRVTNLGTLPALDVRITDDLGPLAGLVSYVPGSGLMNGSSLWVTFAGSVLTADYGALAPGGIVVVRFRVLVEAVVPIGTTITNTGVVSWNSASQNASASVSLDVGGTPGSAGLNGNVWHDAGLDLIFDITETPLAGWSVELYRNNLLVSTVLTNASGAYTINGLLPNLGTPDIYELRFLAPGAGPNTALLGSADSVFTNGLQRISDIIVDSGNNLQNLNLPIWPNGTVYNSVARVPVAGAQLTLFNAATGTPLPDTCFYDTAQQNQITTLNGFYKFDLNFSDLIACPAGGAYLIEVTPPATGFLSGQSQIIPASSDASTAPYSVPTCPGDAVPATVSYCEVVASGAVPPVSELPGSPGTFYHLHLTLNMPVPGDSQIFNNPIPIDPELNGAVAITKTSSMINVTRGALVPYTITVTNVFGAPLYDISIVDRFPAGFKYVTGSARLDGSPAEPRINGRELVWDGLELQFNQKYTLQLLLVVSSGVSEDKYINRAQVFNTLIGTAASGEATATVQVVPDPDFDCTDVIGKVFDDGNLNGWQDTGEKGLTEVRVVTARGLIATTDKHGRFHITCAVVPDEDRGSNFILKLDEGSLPTGYRLTTENPRVQRATRGKMMRFNFGATIHRVVRMDIADGVFEPDTSELRLQWTSKIAQLIEELKKTPSVLRLSYLADVENPRLVRKRLAALKKTITSQWDLSAGGYRLIVETEIFWRRGAPLKGR